MTTATLTLTDFLLARIGEDEAVARDAGDCEQESHPNWEALITDDEGTTIVEDCGCVIARLPWDAVVVGYEAAHIARWDPARVLAECEAKRRIVEPPCWDGDDLPWSGETDEQHRFRRTVEAEWRRRVTWELAQPYANHADFRPEWNPNKRP